MEPGSEPSDDVATKLPDALLRAAFQPTMRAEEPALERAPHLARGTRLGRYRIVRHLGDGGMGAVYEAEQDEPRRRVALKLVPAALGGPGAGSTGLVRRFRREARLLASLQHPGIARILEAGAAELDALGTSVHFLAMELVEGERLDLHARGLDVAQRLELVARTCDAVQHAHQRGIIHRDLKPANVLVATDPEGRDPIGRPVVLDFGIARVLEPFEPGATHQTFFGQVLGTPAYMAPEQAAGEPEGQDTRADVYALGAVLYELLTGVTPIDLSGCGMLEATRRIRELEPVRPSLRDPKLAGEVEAILLHALAKEPDARYPSAGDLAADLRRHLAGEPVEAQPPTAFALLRKAVRRNRALFAGAAAFVALLAVFAAVAALQARENRRLADSESDARRTLSDTAAELRRNLGESRIDRARVATVVGDLARAEELLWGELLGGGDDLAARWGLRELYRRFPRLGSVDLPEPSVWSILLLADGERVLTANHDGKLRVHALGDLVTTVLEPALPAGRQELFASADGRWIVHVGEGTALHALDAERLELVRTIVHPAADVGEGFTSSALEPTSALVNLGDEAGTLRVYDLASGALVEEVDLGLGPLCALQRSADGALLAVGTTLGRIAVYGDPRDLPLLDVAAHERQVADLAFAPDDRTLFTGGSGDRRILRFDLATGERTAVWPSTNGSPRQLTVDVARGRLLGGGWWAFGAWDLATGARTTLVPVPTDAYLHLADRKLFLTGGDGVLSRWSDSVLVGREPTARVGGRACARFLPVSQGGKGLVAADSQGRLTVWDAPGGRGGQDGQDGSVGSARLNVAAGVGRLRSLAVTPDGTTAFAAGLDGALAEVDLQSGAVVDVVRPCLALSNASVAVSDDGARVAYAPERGRVVVRALATKETLFELDLDGLEPTSLAFLPDGGLAVAFREQRVLVFDANGARERVLEADEDLWAVAAARDHPWIAATSWAGSVFVWERGSGRLLAHLRSGRAALWDVAFRPGDEERLAACGGDGVARIWDLVTARELFALDEFGGVEASALAFDHEGRHLLIGSAAGEVRVVDLLEADACIAGNRARFAEAPSASEERD